MTYYTDKISDFLSQKLLSYRNLLLTKFIILDKFSKGKPHLRYIITVFIFIQMFLWLFFYETNNYNLKNVLIGNSLIILISIVTITIIFVSNVFTDTINKFNKSRIYSNAKTKKVSLNFGFDFNTIVAELIYKKLANNSILDENEMSSIDLVNVLFKNHGEHSSNVYFICQPNEVKYVMDKFKIMNSNFKLSGAEKSGKFYIKGKPLIAHNISSAENKKQSSKEFKRVIDNIFDSIISDI